jgi:type IV pilus assembly protein PilM
MANVAWGIDIGNRALKGVKLQRVAEGIKIVDFAFIEHDTILSESGDNRQSLIQTALAKFVGRHDTRKTPICVGVSGQQSFARFVKLPPVEAKKIPEIVKFEAVQQIPFPLDEVEWAYKLFQKPGDPDVEVGIFAIRKELINERVGMFLEVDLDVHAVQTSPLAEYNAMRFDGRLDKGHSIIVDLGADSTDLVIADAESIWMRTLDIGGNNFTEALAKAFKIDFEKAEEMKRNSKTSKYAKQIYQAMRPVFGELVSEIQRSLGFFQSTHRDVQLRKVIALGGGFKLNGLSGYVQKNLQMAVEKPTKFTALPPDETGAAAALSEHVLSAATAYGLALQLMEEAKVTSSLLPMAIRKEKLWRDKTKWFATAAALVVGASLVGLGGYLFHNMGLSQSSAAAAEVDKRIRDASELDKQWTAVTQDGQPQLQQVRNVNLLVSNREYWPMLLEQIDRVLPAPRSPLAEAFRGELGQPGVFDDADVQAIKSIPPDQRDYLKLVRLDSVYTNDLYRIVNDRTPVPVAESVLGQKNPANFAAAKGTPTELRTDLSALEEGSRGYVIRLLLISPLPPDQATVRFKDALQKSLFAIEPNAEQPNLPFLVWLADVRVQPLEQSMAVLKMLEEGHQAREVLRSDPTGAKADAAQQRPGAARPGLGNRPGQPAQAQLVGPVTAENPAFHDPVTGETMLGWSEIRVLLVIQLEPPPWQPPPEPETTEEEPEGTVAGAD